jgi:hypothetical protein
MVQTSEQIEGRNSDGAASYPQDTSECAEEEADGQRPGHVGRQLSNSRADTS